eukprot:1025337-Prymnesium_polylepis.1
MSGRREDVGGLSPPTDADSGLAGLIRASERVRGWRMPVAITGHGGRRRQPRHGTRRGEGGPHGFQHFQEHA